MSALALLNRCALKPTTRLPLISLWDAKTFTINYVSVLLYLVMGTLAPISFFFAYVHVTVTWIPELKVLIPKDDSVLVTGLLVSSFVCGFGLAMWAIGRCFSDQGRSLTKELQLNLSSLHGSLAAAAWRAALAFVIALVPVLLVKLVMPHVQDKAAEFIRSVAISAPALWAIVFLAVVIAPFFEELVFRGYLFNSLRGAFHNGRIFQALGKNDAAADYLAAAVSALAFAVGHMSLTAIPSLFILGFVMAELYRRSGSLVCPMLMHGMNNYIGVLLVLYSIS